MDELKRLFTEPVHGEVHVDLAEDHENPDHRIYLVRNNGSIVVTGLELAGLINWLTMERARKKGD